MIEEQPDSNVTIETVTSEKTSSYPMYKVLLHNDDKTSMQFVVDILRRFFNKEYIAALKIMLEVHEKGCALAGVYMKEHAEFRIDQTVSMARARGFPLSLSMEPE